MEEKDLDKALDEFAKIISEERQISPKTLEPFDLYQQRIKAKIFSEGNHFRDRFIKGYKLIMKRGEKNKQ